MKISCMEWNINGRGGFSGVDFPDFIAKTIMPEQDVNFRPDIIVLVEFFKRGGWKKFCQNLSEEYVLCLSDDYGHGKNQVLIAIKKSLNPVIMHMSSVIPQGRQLLEVPGLEYLHPEFLQVDTTIEKDGERTSLSIMGTRIKSEGANQNYINRMKQYELLISYLDGLTTPVIVMGDFNNGILRDEISASPENALLKYIQPEAKKYNYHLMKSVIQDNYTLLTPSEGCSWPIKLKCGKIVCEPFLEDHCIVNNKIVLNENNPIYSFSDFAKKENGYTLANCLKDKRGNSSFKAGLPDHAYLFGELKL